MGKISCAFFLWMGPMNSEKGPISNSKISKTLKTQECFSYPNPRLVLRHWLRYQVMTNLFLLTRIVGKNTLSLIIPKTNFAKMGNESKFSYWVLATYFLYVSLEWGVWESFFFIFFIWLKLWFVNGNFVMSYLEVHKEIEWNG